MTEPVLVHTRAELEAARAGRVAAARRRRDDDGRAARGHRRADPGRPRGRAEHVVVTHLRQPAAVRAGEDLDRYPRTLDADLELCAGEGVDVVFAPAVGRGLPGRRARGPRRPPARSASVLEGASPARPLRRRAHRRGQAAPPDRAGPRRSSAQKDAQQLALIRRMVRDLDLPVEVVGVPHRARARRPGPVQPQPLPHRRGPARPRSRCRRALAAGRGRSRPDGGAARPPAALAEAARAEPPSLLDYLALVDPPTSPRSRRRLHAATALLAVAARVGTTRLIDNLPLELGA